MLDLTKTTDKKTAFKSVQKYIQTNGLMISDKDQERPWGGYFVIDESSLEPFIDHFFPAYEFKNYEQHQRLSPKVLLVEPEKRLSWQYHHRRSELWKVVHGPVGIIMSDDDSQTDVRNFQTHQFIFIECGRRHRLVGLDNWAVVAEIWQHTDPSDPSAEDDIVRLEDDFGR